MKVTAIVKDSSSIKCMFKSSKLPIKHHNFENILLHDFLTSMKKASLARKDSVFVGKQCELNNISDHYVDDNNKHFSAARNQKITVTLLFERLNSITDNTIVMVDVVDTLFDTLFDSPLPNGFFISCLLLFNGIRCSCSY